MRTLYSMTREERTKEKERRFMRSIWAILAFRILVPFSMTDITTGSSIPIVVMAHIVGALACFLIAVEVLLRAWDSECLEGGIHPLMGMIAIVCGSGTLVYTWEILSHL